MRILVLSPTFLPVVGGAELVLYEVYRRIARRHEVLLITPLLTDEILEANASPEHGDSTVPFAVRRYRERLTFMRMRGHRLTAGAIPPFSLSAVGATRSAIAEFAPHVLNVHYLMPTGLAGLVADRYLGVPTVLTLNGRDVPGPGVPALWKRWQRWLISATSDVTYVSDYCRRAIHGSGKAPGSVIYNGVEIPAPQGDGARLRERLALEEDEFVVFTLSRLAAEKRIDVVLRGMRHLVAHGHKATLIVGGTGREARRLEALAKELGLQDHVHFAGFIPEDELPSYFAACDAFAFHSTFETFGIVVAQAMSYGKPVVTANNTALPEVLGDAGLLVDTGDSEAFGAALLQLAGDPQRRERLGSAGRGRAGKLFDWDAIARQYESTLCRAAEGRVQ